MQPLDRLANLKGRFGAESARQTAALLAKLRRAPIREPEQLIRLHELVLFLRAFPPSPRVLALADEILFRFARRVRGLDPDPFEAPEISGIAGAALSTNFSYQVALSLAARYPDSIHIDWENYEHPERLGPLLARFLPIAREAAAVEPHPDFRRLFESSRLDLLRLLQHTSPDVYDLLEIPLRWQLGDSPASRSRGRLPRRDIFYHDAPFLTRRDVSLEAEFTAPKIPVAPVPRARPIVDLILDTSSVRYRELWGFLHADAAHVHHAGLGRGVDMFFFGVPPDFRMPLRAYHAAMLFKNGVPLGYLDALSVCEHLSISFNLYYTFRDGESAWVFARVLKLFREQLGVTCFSIDPYALGHENQEAIDSGAFWFYRKLGFRTASREIAPLLAREERRIAARPGYRTQPATLRQLANAPLLYGGGPEWDRFDPHRLETALPPALLRAKRAPEEIAYLRATRRDPKFRARILSAASAAASRRSRES